MGHLPKETEPSGVYKIRSLKAENLSRKAQDTILQSWRHNTQKQYSTYLKNGSTIVLNRMKITLTNLYLCVLEYLTNMYEEGLSYSFINTARSHYGIMVLKCAFYLKPPFPRYRCTFDVKLAFNHSEQLQLIILRLKPIW